MVSAQSPIPATAALEPVAEARYLHAFDDWVVVNLTVGEAGRLLRDDPLAPAPPSRLTHFALCDARGVWTLVDQSVYMYASAELLCGSIDDLGEASGVVTCMALLAGNRSRTVPASFDPDRAGTGTRRLAIGVNWEYLTLMGRPFVIRTARGYAPALRAYSSSGELVHVLLGAQSLCKGLFGFAQEEEDFTGVTVRIKKASEIQTAPYIVEQARSPDGR